MNAAQRLLRLSSRPAGTLALALLLCALGPMGVFAQDHRDASIGIYLQEAGSRLTCSRVTPLSCADPKAVTAGEVYVDYVAYLGVFNADAQLGVLGLECSLRFDDATRSGVDINSWTLCADIDYPHDEWGQRSGDGNRIVWILSESGCQQEEPAGIGTGVTAIAGFFTLTAYSEDRLQIAPWKGTDPDHIPSCSIADCNGDANYFIAPENQGYVAFSDDGSLKGHLPCTQRIQEKTTWGTVKDLYNDRR